MMGGFGFGGMSWIGMILMLVITIGVIVGLVLLVVWVVRRMSANTSQASTQLASGQSAKDIAQARYARGEINREEFQQVLSDISR